MIKSRIPSFFQINPSTGFPLVSLVVSVLSIFLLLNKTSSQPKPRGVSSSIILDFNKNIAATLLIHRYFITVDVTFFENSSMFPATTLSILMSYLYPFFILSRISHLHLWLFHLDHCRFILVASILTLGLRLTPLLWRPPPQHRSCLPPLIFPLPFGKVLVHLVTPILFIISLSPLIFTILSFYFHLVFRFSS